MFPPRIADRRLTPSREESEPRLPTSLAPCVVCSCSSLQHHRECCLSVFQHSLNVDFGFVVDRVDLVYVLVILCPEQNSVFVLDRHGQVSVVNSRRIPVAIRPRLRVFHHAEQESSEEVWMRDNGKRVNVERIFVLLYSYFKMSTLVTMKRFDLCADTLPF